MTIKIKNKKTTAIITTIGLAMSAGFIIGIGGWFGGGASIPADTMTRGLVGYWSFDEGMGDTAYNAAATGSVNDGAITGASWTIGKKGGALEFDGIDDYVDIGSVSGTIKTIEFWLKVPNTNTQKVIDIDGADYIEVNGSNQIAAVSFLGTTTYYVNGINTQTISAIQWLHIVITDTTGVSPTDMDIGAQDIGGTPSYFTGELDEARIYDRVLTAEEIRYHYNRGGPVAEYKFNTGSGSTAYDTSGSVPGHDATIHSCPEGYIPIPGNSDYGTEDGFCVMKYEAKCASTSDPTTGLISPDTGYNTYNDSNTACISANSKVVVSTASGYPIAYVDQETDAKDYCASIGAHLITNNEWMTIARNAEQVSSNWSGGSPNIFARGWAANEAAVYGSDPWTNLKAAPSTGPNCLYNATAADTCGSTGVHLYRRTLTLSNGEEIWDLSGNVWEWTDNTVTRGNQPQPAGWNEIAKNGVHYNKITTWTAEVPYSAVGPLDTDLNDANGIGRIYSYYSPGNSDVYAFRRGGSWNDGSLAGAFSLDLYYLPSDTCYYLGFRCSR